MSKGRITWIHLQTLFSISINSSIYYCTVQGDWHIVSSSSQWRNPKTFSLSSNFRSNHQKSTKNDMNTMNEIFPARWNFHKHYNITTISCKPQFPETSISSFHQEQHTNSNIHVQIESTQSNSQPQLIVHSQIQTEPIQASTDPNWSESRKKKKKRNPEKKKSRTWKRSSPEKNLADRGISFGITFHDCICVICLNLWV